MRDDQRQQALDALKNALARCEQSDFYVEYVQGGGGVFVWIKGTTIGEPELNMPLSSISNHTLRLKSEE